MPKIPWPSKQLPLSTSGNWDHWCVWQVHCPLFECCCKESCWCVWWSQGATVAPPTPVPVCGQGKRCQHIGLCASLNWHDLFHFLVAFNVLTSNTHTACHLPLCQCIAIAFRILILSVSFIVPSVMQCYLAHWLNILSITQPIMRLQHGAMFYIA